MTACWRAFRAASHSFRSAATVVISFQNSVIGKVSTDFRRAQ